MTATLADRIEPNFTAIPSKLTSGYVLMVWACALAALTGLLVGVLYEVEPEVSSLAASFVRVAMQVVFVALLLRGRLQYSRPQYSSGRAAHPASVLHHLLGDRHPLLWLWGALGALCVSTYYASMVRIGFGAAAFLGATSGAFTALFAPWVLKQRNGPVTWFAIGLALAGVYCLRGGDALGVEVDVIGWICGLLSGVTGGLAYLVVARLGARAPAVTVMSYWAMLCIVFHLLVFAFVPPSFPTETLSWVIALGAGLVASLSQYYMTLAYQRSPAAPLGALSNLAPVLSLALDAAVFARIPTVMQAVGAGMILAGSLLLPFRARRAE